MITVFNMVMVRRRAGLTGWTLGFIGVVALLAIAYPAFDDNSELDDTFADLPDSVQTLLGLGNGLLLSSPAGYLNSQWFANILPVMLLIFGVGLAAWSIAGDESAGTLELLLANPISRWRVAVARIVALTASLGLLTAASAGTLALLAAPTGLDDGLPISRMVAATTASALLAWVFAAIAFAVGAATANRTAAITTASAIAVTGYVIEGLAEAVTALRPIRAISPWHWMFDADPVNEGLTLPAWLPAVLVAVALFAAGTWRFTRRDLH